MPYRERPMNRRVRRTLASRTRPQSPSGYPTYDAQFIYLWI